MRTKSENNFYVYALLDPRKEGPHRYGRWVFSHEPFYIGKGKGRRAWMHLSGGDTPQSKRCLSINRGAKKVIVIIKRRGLYESDAFALEKLLIDQVGLIRSGGPLLNRNIGGAGGSLPGRKVSAETKEKQSKVAYAREAAKSKKEKQRIGAKIGKATAATWRNKTLAERQQLVDRRTKSVVASWSQKSEAERQAIAKRAAVTRKEKRIELTISARNKLDKQTSRRISEATKAAWANKSERQKQIFRAKQVECGRKRQAALSPEQKARRNKKLSEATTLQMQRLTQEQRSDRARAAARAYWESITPAKLAQRRKRRAETEGRL